MTGPVRLRPRPTFIISTTVYYVVCLDAAGLRSASCRAATRPRALGGGAIGDGSIPDVASTVTPIGIFKVATNASATFTAGTTALDGRRNRDVLRRCRSAAGRRDLTDPAVTQGACFGGLFHSRTQPCLANQSPTSASNLHALWTLTVCHRVSSAPISGRLLERRQERARHGIRWPERRVLQLPARAEVHGAQRGSS